MVGTINCSQCCLYYCLNLTLKNSNIVSFDGMCWVGGWELLSWEWMATPRWSPTKRSIAPSLISATKSQREPLAQLTTLRALDHGLLFRIAPKDPVIDNEGFQMVQLKNIRLEMAKPLHSIQYALNKKLLSSEKGNTSSVHNSKSLKYDRTCPDHSHPAIGPPLAYSGFQGLHIRQPSPTTGMESSRISKVRGANMLQRLSNLLDYLWVPSKLQALLHLHPTRTSIIWLGTIWESSSLNIPFSSGHLCNQSKGSTPVFVHQKKRLVRPLIPPSETFQNCWSTLVKPFHNSSVVFKQCHLSSHLFE